jgi:hypothetical protein
MTNFKWFATAAIAAAALNTLSLSAETHCPGNVASLPFHLVNRYQIVVPVSLNRRGPYNFLLDTGTQITILDQSLAHDLQLATEGDAAVAGVGFHESATFSHLDLLEAGLHSVPNPKVLVYDLGKLHSAELRIDGILGEDFLEKFDMLIDNAHSQVCLDATAALRAGVKGTHVPLLASQQPSDGARLPASLVVMARLTDGMRPVRLKLDSGSNVPFLYNSSEYMATGLARGASFHGGGANGAQQSFTSLPAQTVKMNGTELSRVTFLSAHAQKDASTTQFDGLLPMGLFRRVFINHAEGYVVLEP